MLTGAFEATRKLNPLQLLPSFPRPLINPLLRRSAFVSTTDDVVRIEQSDLVSISMKGLVFVIE